MADTKQRGAPIGNQNAIGGELASFKAALRRAITQDNGEKLRKAAEALQTKASEGEAWAVKELRDTLDGKPAQSVEVAGPNGGPLQVERIERVIVKPE